MSEQSERGARLLEALGELTLTLRSRDPAEPCRMLVEQREIRQGTFAAVPADPTAWNDAAESRSHLRLLHGFSILSDAARLLDEQADGGALVQACCELIRRWQDAFAPPAACAPDGSAPASSVDGRSADPMAYHDETTALRLQHLLLFEAAAGTSLTDERAAALQQLTDATADLLATEEFHSPGTNHGMFQDLALLHHAAATSGRRPEDALRHQRIAMRRLHAYFTGSFTSEGIHKEHAPSYHLMVSRYLRGMPALAAELDPRAAPDYHRLFERAEHYATHAITPAGVFPPVSDSFHRRIEATGHARTFPGPGYRYAVTRGREGSMPAERVAVFPESGYAVFRERWGDPEAVYAFFTAAYNGSYHKHCDDLSLFVYRGRELLREAGPNGYDYSDPFTQYAYSSFAHNSLVVDGTSLPRDDGKSVDVTMTEEDVSDGRAVVSATNARWPGVVHCRRITWSETPTGVHLVVDDEMRSAQEHRYTLLWHVGATVRTELRGDSVALYADETDEKILEMQLTAETPLVLHTRRAVTKKPLTGWYFPHIGKRAPNDTVHVDIAGADVRVRTEMRFSDFLLPDLPELPDLSELADQPDEPDRAEPDRAEPHQVLVPHLVEVLPTGAARIRVEGESAGTRYAFYLVRDGEVRVKSQYSPDSTCTFAVEPGQRYRIRVFRRTRSGTQLPSFTTRPFRTGN